jgi:diguanylate cyclase (GGDEF)-like protein
MTHDSAMLQDGDFIFEDESGAGNHLEKRLVWRVLLVDDDPDVHQATVFAVGQHQLVGRSIEFLHAYSAAQARELLLSEKDLAIVILDVVMESETAGLDLVGHIRQIADLRNTRIVLRTGQPGYAPELDTILKHDINDYKTKSELSQIKLLTLLTTTLRSYKQLGAIDANRQGLSLIVRASGSFMQMQGLGDFAVGVITQLAALLGTNPQGVVCAQTQRQSNSYIVLAAAGRYAAHINEPLESLSNPSIRHRLVEAFDSCHSDFGSHDLVMYFGQKSGLDMAVYIDVEHVPGPVETELLNVFCANLSACLHNQSLIEQLRSTAFFDEMLKLPNRSHFIAEIDARKAAQMHQWSIALVDIDDFSSINELMGHHYGDELLKALAIRLQAAVGQDVLLARVSGNAFGLLGPDLYINPERINLATCTPLLVENRPHKITATSSYVSIEGDLQSGADYLKNATVALKQAKRQCRGQHMIYTADVGTHARSRAVMLAELHIAFDSQHLSLAYQPQIDLVSGRLIGLEALIRWRKEDGQMVPPDRFIPVAEQTGLIVAIGEWTLNQSCTMMKQLIDCGLAPQRMAVNVSVEQFKSPGFFDAVIGALDRAELDGSRLELEITESVAMLDSNHVKAQLIRLREQRIAVAIDDFGTGYSSLSYLEQLPLDRMKIDKAFVQQLGQPGSPRIAEMIVELGRTLGLRVLAEGIEDQATCDVLQTMGCHEGQGYFISRPLESSKLLAWLGAYLAS